MYAPGFYDYAGGELCFYNGMYADDYGPEGCLLLSGHRAVRAPLPLQPWPRLVTIQRKPCALEKGRWRVWDLSGSISSSSHYDFGGLVMDLVNSSSGETEHWLLRLWHVKDGLVILRGGRAVLLQRHLF
jgi:hypothetical protein